MFNRFAILAIVSTLIGLLLPPELAVSAFLPPQYASLFHTKLVSSLWFAKFCLLGNAALLATWPLVRKHFFRPEGAPSSSTSSTLPVLTGLDACLMAVLTLLAGSLRAWGISAGFSFDEITISMSMSEKSLPHLLMRAEPWRLVPALLSFFLYRLFGVSELCARLPSFVAGVLTIPLLYLLARHWMKTGYALAAAAILALSTFHLWYSQLSTSYALAMFFILLSMLALERVLADDRSASWFRWGATLPLALITHFQLAVFVLVAQGLRVAFPRIPGLLQRKMVAKYCIVSAYSCAIAVTVVSVNVFTWSSVFTWSLVSSAVAIVPNHVHSTPRVPIADFMLLIQWLGNAYAPWYLQLGIGVAVVAGLLLLGRRDTAVTIYLLLPTVLFWLLFAVRAIRLVEPRYSLFTLIPLCMLCGTGIAGSIERARLRRRGAPRLVAFGFATVLLGATLGGAGISLQRYTSRERFPFRATARLLAAHVAGGEKVYFCGFGYHQFKYYYPQMMPLPDYDSLERAMDRGEDMWIVYYERDYLGKMPEVLRRRVLTETTEVFSYEARTEQNLEELGSFVRRYDRSSAPKSP